MEEAADAKGTDFIYLFYKKNKRVDLISLKWFSPLFVL